MERSGPFYTGFVACLLIAALVCTTQAQYSGGSGATDDPYQIATADDLILLGQRHADYDKHFILTSDIDLAGDGGAPRVFARAVIAWDGAVPFSGVFHGNGHIISNLTIVGENYLGLFGRLDTAGAIVALGLESVDVSGNSDAGGLVGSNSGSVSRSHCTGTVEGNERVGGLVGNHSGSISSSYSTATVDGSENVGGLVGCGSGQIMNSYGAGAVHGETNVGGLLGQGRSSITSIVNCSSSGDVSGTARVGGLVGWNAGSIISSYSIGAVSGETEVAGLAAFNGGRITSCFWDIDTSGQVASDGGRGLASTEMLDAHTYIDGGWDFVGESLNGVCDYWQISPGEYPTLRCFSNGEIEMPAGAGTPAQPYLIRDTGDLGAVWLEPEAHFRLGASLDLEGIAWSMAPLPWFRGTFDGNGHVIANLRVRGGNYLGFVGILDSGGRVLDLGLEGVAISGAGQWIGGLVGDNRGVIRACYSTGTISGRSDVGGLAGGNHHTITSCYSTGKVSGDWRIGGLVGDNHAYAATCYSLATVRGEGAVGGLVGGNRGAVLCCVWDTGSSGLLGSNGGVGLTTAEMMVPETLGLNGFSSDPNWVLSAGNDYPRLAWQGTAGGPIPQPLVDWLDGQGSEAVPYQLVTANQLVRLSRAGGLAEKSFVLAGDLDLEGLPWHQAVIPYFVGSFDGRGHSIRNLSIEGESDLGLFGRLGFGAMILNLRLEEVHIIGTGDCVGALAGHNSHGSITNAHSRGAVAGDDDVGGLVGSNDNGSIADSSSHVTLNGDSSIGGLVGANWHGDIRGSCSTGAVNGVWASGGLVGYASGGDISDSYSTGAVHGVTRVGGLLGNGSGTAIVNTYSIATVTGETDVGGLIGSNSGSVSSSFWDILTSGVTTSAGGTGLVTSAMLDLNTFLDAGWDLVDETTNGVDDIWTMPVGTGYPLLTWQAGAPGAPDASDASDAAVEDFETGDFSAFDWQRWGGDVPWSITSSQVHGGSYSAQAGDVGDDETSTLRLTYDCAAGQVSFFVKTSSERGFDYLIFHVDGQERDRWSGEQEWVQVSYTVSAGTHTFEWSYEKDGSVANGSDTAWLDDITLP